jgi:alcohol dehydrogenase class IV
MNIEPFALSRVPRILFGAGRIVEVPALIRDFGTRVLLITGEKSFLNSPCREPLLDGLKRHDISWLQETVSGEPSPQWVDDAVTRHRASGIEVVMGIGGGSVLDAGKAVAGLLPHNASVMNFLEGVGGREYAGPALPYIAAPTTAGTGSEATKNAVLSVQGAAGFKKSFRHECLVPAYAVVDPGMLSTCSPALIAANGMDALTQLMESYVSSKANPVTDALALSGILAVKDGFFAAWRGGDDPAAAAGRAAMAYAALLSGLTLAQVGLGSVHGLASPLGAFFPIPHGVVCGTLLAAAVEVNIRALRSRQAHHPALRKYAELGALLSGTQPVTAAAAETTLVELLHEWTERLALPRLRDYGVTLGDFPKIIANCRGNSMKTNPIVLGDEEVRNILSQRL